MSELKDKLIVALDVDTLEKAKKIVDVLGDKVKFYKIGSQLFTSCGQDAIKMIGEKGGRVFLDLKFYDIPKTVYSAVASGTASTIALHSILSGSGEIKIKEQVKKATAFPVFMMTVHIQGGTEMLKQAVEGATVKARELNIDRPFIIGVTVLTSRLATEEEVLESARNAKEAGLDGVVCSAYEAKKIRTEFGKDFIIVTPGIRPKGVAVDDQKRVATAKEAIEAGATYIVVGRPILEAKDPLKAVAGLLMETH
ncbi:MAG: orotidine-5'-phosphate decarboxylase [Candidatus Omnitrophica bacterium]|nr:orotidine-5'-phosphate decarboxylase [Candidatus Omnitrophota bacterium]